MNKLLVFFVLTLLSCSSLSRNYNLIYLKSKTNLSVAEFESGWYKILENYTSQKDCDSIQYASSCLCIQEATNDTVLVVSPCIKYRIEIGRSAKLYKNLYPPDKDGYVAFNKKFEQKFIKLKKIYGDLKIPHE